MASQQVLKSVDFPMAGLPTYKNIMKQVELEFQGYTWDEYFYVIANKPGILVAYRGGLDNEGAIKLDEIIYIDEADELGTLYESNKFAEIRNNVSNNDRIFFSYTEMKTDDRAEVTESLRQAIDSNSSLVMQTAKVNFTFKGACALFP